jgi:hypothetical protein
VLAELVRRASAHVWPNGFSIFSLQLRSSGEIEEKQFGSAVGFYLHLGLDINCGAIARCQSIAIEPNGASSQPCCARPRSLPFRI